MNIGDRPLISACILSRNSADTIADAINSVRKHVDEIIVLDSASTDGTLSRLGALSITPGAPIRIHHAAEEVPSALYPDGDASDMAALRNQSFALASPEAEWILWLDPDEKVRGDTDLHELVSSARPYTDGFRAAAVSSDDSSALLRERIVRRGRLVWRHRMHEQLEPVMQDARIYDSEGRLPAIDRTRFHVVHTTGEGDLGNSDPWKVRVLRDMEREALERHEEPSAHVLLFLGQAIEMTDPKVAFVYYVRAGIAGTEASYAALGSASRLLRVWQQPWVCLLVDALIAARWPSPATCGRLAAAYCELGWAEPAERYARHALAAADDDPRVIDTEPFVSGRRAEEVFTRLKQIANLNTDMTSAELEPTTSETTP